mgnify:CR=1 FL=1
MTLKVLIKLTTFIIGGIASGVNGSRVLGAFQNGGDINGMGAATLQLAVVVSHVDTMHKKRQQRLGETRRLSYTTDTVFPNPSGGYDESVS